jgi:tetratricopeptide (TPR) repeat protein
VTSPALAPVAWDDTEGTVDAEHPWPGLASYRELQQDYFFGRDAEIDALYRRVGRKSLTVLFGQSGLGKSSLLHAGLFPVLRKDGMLPVSIRLDYADAAPPLDAQVRSALGDAVRAAGGTLPGDAAVPVTLWELFHDPERAPRDALGQPIVVVLVIDQFEEMFTQGYATDGGRARAGAFVSALAAIVERWVPSAVESRLARDTALAERLDYDRDDVRVLISLREDYLPHLEELRTALPAIGGGGMRLTRMSAKEGLEAVLGPGGALVTADVADQIMRFVSRTHRTATTVPEAGPSATQESLTDTEVEPSLLSLFCRELNARRLAKGLPRISAELLLGSSEDILADFYNRALCDQPPAVRAFVEDELVTDSGVRENIAVERAERTLARAGAPAGALDVLVGRRLLHIEERLGTRRVELTHDVLIPVIKRSRAERQQREQLEDAERREAETSRLLRERTHKTRVYIGGLLAVVVVLAWAWGDAMVEKHRARESDARTRTESELTGQFLRTIGGVLRYAADSNISGRAVERYFLQQSKPYLDSLHRMDANSLRVMTTMATFDVLMAGVDQAYRATDSTKSDSLHADGLAHADSTIAMSKAVISRHPDPLTRYTAYNLVAWAGEMQRTMGDTDLGIAALRSADSLAEEAETEWENPAHGGPALSDSTIRQAPRYLAALEDELGRWSLIRRKWAVADSAYTLAVVAERRWARRPSQADSQVGDGLEVTRLSLQAARARRLRGDSIGFRMTYPVIGDSVRVLLRRLPGPVSDSASALGARTPADSEAVLVSSGFDLVVDDLMAAHDSAGALRAIEDELTIDSTLGTRYRNRQTLVNLAYTVNRRTQARLGARQYAAAAADYGTLAGLRRRILRLPPHTLRKDSVAFRDSVARSDAVNLAGALGGEAWALLLAHRPADALRAANEGLATDPTQLFIHTNQAHALLLTGHYDDAMRIYRTYWKTKINARQTFGAAILGDSTGAGDFRDLAAAGVTDPALHKAEQALRSEFPRS